LKKKASMHLHLCSLVSILVKHYNSFTTELKGTSSFDNPCIMLYSSTVRIVYKVWP